MAPECAAALHALHVGRAGCFLILFLVTPRLQFAVGDTATYPIPSPFSVRNTPSSTYCDASILSLKRQALTIPGHPDAQEHYHMHPKDADLSRFSQGVGR